MFQLIVVVKFFSQILFKAIGMSLNLEVNEDTLDTTEMETFLHTIGRELGGCSSGSRKS